MKDDRFYLLFINECIEKIRRYVGDSKSEFVNDEKTQDAVLRNLHVMTESIQRLSEEIKDKYPEVDWRAVSSFRNVIVHDYLGIDLNQIWDILVRDIPSLQNSVQTILKDLIADYPDLR